MGQIFNRIRRITKSHLNDSAEEGRRFGGNIDDNDDEALGRIIDELNNENSNNNQNNNNNQSNRQSSGQSGEPDEGPMTIQKAGKILGTKPNSTAGEIKSAYLRKIKEYHPDKVASLGDELKNLAERKTLEINLAYKFLTKV